MKLANPQFLVKHVPGRQNGKLWAALAVLWCLGGSAVLQPLSYLARTQMAHDQDDDDDDGDAPLKSEPGRGVMESLLMGCLRNDDFNRLHRSVRRTWLGASQTWARPCFARISAVQRGRQRDRQFADPVQNHPSFCTVMLH